MNTLTVLYERWEILTQAEGDAMQGRDWTKVLKVQAEKKSLASEIAAFTTQPATRPEKRITEEELAPILARLVALESNNCRILTELRRRLKEEKSALAQASRNLSQLHRAYASGPQPVWHSYS